MNNTVFNTGQARLAAMNAPFLENFFTAWNTRPHNHPSKTRGTNKVNNRPNGLICSRAALNAEPPVTAMATLVAPKAAPQTAPAAGPKMMAPTATGTVKNVMVSPGVLKYPRGENAMITMMATIKATLVMNKVRVRVIVTVEFFIVFSFSSDKTAPMGVPLFFSSFIIEVMGIAMNEMLTNRSDRSKQNPAFCIQTRQYVYKQKHKKYRNFLLPVAAGTGPHRFYDPVNDEKSVTVQ